MNKLVLDDRDHQLEAAKEAYEDDDEQMQKEMIRVEQQCVRIFVYLYFV